MMSLAVLADAVLTMVNFSITLTPWDTSKGMYWSTKCCGEVTERKKSLINDIRFTHVDEVVRVRSSE